MAPDNWALITCALLFFMQQKLEKHLNQSHEVKCCIKTEGTPTPTGNSVLVEGNPDNPFGVRLRKTSALHRFGSEEENPEVMIPTVLLY